MWRKWIHVCLLIILCVCVCVCVCVYMCVYVYVCVVGVCWCDVHVCVCVCVLSNSVSSLSLSIIVAPHTSHTHHTHITHISSRTSHNTHTHTHAVVEKPGTWTAESARKTAEVVGTGEKEGERGVQRGRDGKISRAGERDVGNVWWCYYWCKQTGHQAWQSCECVWYKRQC